jgi:hypothetical protein
MKSILITTLIPVFVLTVSLIGCGGTQTSDYAMLPITNTTYAKIVAIDFGKDYVILHFSGDTASCVTKESFIASNTTVVLGNTYTINLHWREGGYLIPWHVVSILEDSIPTTGGGK